MTQSASPKLAAYASIGALGLLAALGLGLPELAAVTAPLLVLLGVGLASARGVSVEADVVVTRERALEDEEVDLTLVLVARTRIELLEVLLALPDGLTVAEGENPVALRLRAGERRELELRLRCERWGAYRVGDVFLRARDTLGFFRYESRVDRRAPLKVYPRPETLRALPRPAETQVFAGNQVSRQKGDGIEFADIRPFVAGDRVRRINWRASARRSELWVNERHAERNADVVVFLDSFAEARERRAGTLDVAARAAAELVERYLREKDRVGFVVFGGVLNWLVPGTGLVQLYRILDALLDTEILLNYAWRGIDVLPRRTLPPQALVIALTPLLDERATGALLDLRARGFDLVVVDVSPLPFVTPGGSAEEQLAYRIWQLRREGLRSEFERRGVPVGTWDEARGLVGALEEVTAFRRFARFSRV